MTASRIVPARLAISRAQELVNLSFSGPLLQNNDVKLFGTNAWSSVSGFAAHTAARLQAIRNRFPDLRLTDGERDAAVEQMHGLGLWLFAELLGVARDNPPRIATGTLQTGAQEPLIVDVECVCDDSLFFPLELLPLLVPRDSQTTASHTVAASMLGFGAACHRPTAFQKNLDTSRLERAVRFFWYAKLPNAKRQWAWLSERIDSRGPRPTKPDTTESILREIIQKDGTGLVAAVEHFHCHHKRAEPNDPGDVDRLILRSSSWRSGELALESSEFARAGFAQEPKAGLVFLNACSSQSVQPTAVSAIARNLLQNGRNAVITTWTDVEEDLGYAMATRTYEALLKGEAVSAALREARIRVLQELNNPFGLLYTVYGDSRFSLPLSRH